MACEICSRVLVTGGDVGCVMELETWWWWRVVEWWELPGTVSITEFGRIFACLRQRRAALVYQGMNYKNVIVLTGSVARPCGRTQKSPQASATYRTVI